MNEAVTQQATHTVLCPLCGGTQHPIKEKNHCMQSRGEGPSTTGQRTQFNSYLEQLNNYLRHFLTEL